MHARRMTFRVEEPAEDWLLDPQLYLDGFAGAADLVADDFFPALFAQPGDLRLKSVCLGGRQVEGPPKS